MEYINNRNTAYLVFQLRDGLHGVSIVFDSWRHRYKYTGVTRTHFKRDFAAQQINADSLFRGVCCGLTWSHGAGHRAGDVCLSSTGRKVKSLRWSTGVVRLNPIDKPKDTDDTYSSQYSEKGCVSAAAFKDAEGSSPRTEVRLQAAEAHHGDLQAGGSAVIPHRPDGPRRQQRRTQRGAQGGAKASVQFAHGGHLGERGVLTLGPWTLFIFLDGWELLNDASINFTVCLRSQTHT